MKSSISKRLFEGLILIASLSSCSKSSNKPSNSKQPGGGGNTTTMVPVTVSHYDGTNSSFTTTFNYQYDSNGLLTKYGKDNAIIYNITPHQVMITTDNYEGSTLSNIYTQTYDYSGSGSTPVDIYTAAPTQVNITYAAKDVIAGTTTSNPYGVWGIKANPNLLPTQFFTSDNGGRNFDFIYDSNGNLSKADFISLSGTRAGLPYSEMKIVSLDNKPSPYSSVKGWAFISYPQNFDIDYAQAFCKNNPIKITYSQYDDNAKALVINETDDFVYTYNAQGYPTTIVETMTYASGSPNVSTRTYNYTYK